VLTHVQRMIFMPIQAAAAGALQFKKRLSKKLGLRRLPLPKPVSHNADVYHVLTTHWIYHKAVYADEIQRLYVVLSLPVEPIILASLSRVKNNKII
jgi:hypothetical protein